MLPELAIDAISQALPRDAVTPVTTYLANAIERLDKNGQVVASVPYSTISAIDSSPSLPLDYQWPDDAAATKNRIPLVINNWTARQLSAEKGTLLRVAYYEPEVENGREIERTFDAVVTDIVAITKPATPYDRRHSAIFDTPPTVYNDPDLTPSVPGVTDQESISDWDLPFKLERKLSDEDDDYWKEYRLTPKAFMPLEAGRRLFGSRFGQTTGLKIATDNGSEVELANRIRTSLTPVLADLGWSVRPIRSQQLASSRGTTPFDALFLSLSLFVILAAVMLIAMLFRLGLIQRLRQFGTLMAVGWTPGRVTKLTLIEGLLIAATGVVLGVIGGIIYAKIVLWALRTLWVGRGNRAVFDLSLDLAKRCDRGDRRLAGCGGDHLVDDPIAAESRCANFDQRSRHRRTNDTNRQQREVADDLCRRRWTGRRDRCGRSAAPAGKLPPGDSSAAGCCCCWLS